MPCSTSVRLPSPAWARFVPFSPFGVTWLGPRCQARARLFAIQGVVLGSGSPPDVSPAGAHGNTPGGSGAVNIEIEVAEATGIGSASSILPEGRSRIPFPDLRTEPAAHPRWPSRWDAPSHPRYRARARKLTAEQETTIRALSRSRSLHSLATDFGVSHETIRAAVRHERRTAWVDRRSKITDASVTPHAQIPARSHRHRRPRTLAFCLSGDHLRPGHAGRRLRHRRSPAGAARTPQAIRTPSSHPPGSQAEESRSRPLRKHSASACASSRDISRPATTLAALTS